MSIISKFASVQYLKCFIGYSNIILSRIRNKGLNQLEMSCYMLIKNICLITHRNSPIITDYKYLILMGHFFHKDPKKILGIATSLF